MDIFDAAVDHLANDDYNHIPEPVLRARLEALRLTHSGEHMLERADAFIAEVREWLTEVGDPEYGPG